MEGKDFKALRESMGITKKWIAKRMNVSVETINRWESGHANVFATAVDMLQSLDDYFEKLANQLVETTRQLGPDVRINNLLCYNSDNEFWRYHPDAKPLPSTAHNSVMKRTQAKLGADGYVVNLVKMDRDRYFSWLNGRKDTAVLRQNWADLQIADNSLSEVDIRQEERDDDFSEKAGFAMTAEKFRAFRNSVGLSAEELSALLAVEPDQVKLWESGDNTLIPEKAVKTLFDIEHVQAEMLDEIRAFAIKMTDAKVQMDMVRLPRFLSKEDLWEFYAEFYPLPVSVYEVGLKQVEQALLELNILPAIYVFDSDTYKKWLGTQKDSMEMRIKWGNLQVANAPDGPVN